MTSTREDQFLSLWQRFSGAVVTWEREYRFHPVRKWRIDFFHVASRVGVEIDSVTYFGKRVSRHQTAKGYMADCEKYNSALEMGIRILRYSQKDLDVRPIQVLEQIKKVIEA